MKTDKRMLVLTTFCCLLLAGAAAAWAGGLKQKVASCFPPPPAGYTADEVEFDADPGDRLLEYLKTGKEVKRYYEGPEEVEVSILSRGMPAFEYAAKGMNPGCKVTKVAGRTAVIMYDADLVVMIGKKAAVMFSGDNDWPDSKAAIMPLAEKFDYRKLESLLD